MLPLIMIFGTAETCLEPVKRKGAFYRNPAARQSNKVTHHYWPRSMPGNIELDCFAPNLAKTILTKLSRFMISVILRRNVFHPWYCAQRKPNIINLFQEG